MHWTLRPVCGALLIGALALTACGSSGDSSPDAGSSGGADAAVSFTGTFHHYVTSSIKVGSTPTEADSYAFNIDGNAPAKDNVIGHVLALVSSYVNIDDALATALGKGEFVVLHSVRADALASDSSVSWKIYLGKPFVAPAVPDFGGSGTFMLADNAQSDDLIGGSITGGVFATAPATPGNPSPFNVTIAISFIEGSDPLEIPVYGVQLQAKITDSGCTEGKLGGGIRSVDIQTTVVPALADELDARIAAEPNCRNEPHNCSTDNQSILTIFDTNMDYVISVEEVQNNGFVKGALQADLDLLPEKGTDGKDAESVSIGLGFTCAGANFTVASEQ